MERRIITVPPGVLKFTTAEWDIDWRGQGLGDTNQGVSKTVVNALPRWVGSPSVVLTPDMIGHWRGIRAHAQGMVGVYRIQMVDPVVYEDERFLQSLTWSNGQTFSAGKGWAFDPTCAAPEAAARGAEEITISSPERPRVGQIMSHDLWPFAVTWVEVGAADTYRIGVQMPLRSDIAVGDRIKLRGEGLFEATDESMGNPAYGLDRVSRPRLSFREWINR